MKHLLKKLSVAGAGLFSSNKPKPPIYKPPVMGELQYGASHSYAETLDLLSDGPIEGLVNSHGELVDGLNILQGIYLDDTPVAVTQQSAKRTNEITALELETIESFNVELVTNSGGVEYLSKFFKALTEVTKKSADGRITALPSTTAGGTDNFESASSPDVGMLFFRTMKNSIGFAEHVILKGPPLLPKKVSDYAFYIRGFIEYGSKTFSWYLGETLQTSYSASNAAYRKNDQTKGSVQDSSLIWADDDELESSKFLFAFIKSGTPSDDIAVITSGDQKGMRTTALADDRIFANSTKVLGELTREDLTVIYNLSILSDDNGGNAAQRTLAERVLKRIGWNGGGVNNLLADYLDVRSGGVVICRVNYENPGLVDKRILDGNVLIEMETMPFGEKYEFNLISYMQNAGIRVTDVTCPVVSADGILSGEMHGFLIFEFPIEDETSDNYIDIFSSNITSRSVYGTNHTSKISSQIIDALKDLTSLKYSKRIKNGPASTILPLNPAINSIHTNSVNPNGLKFNYSNILAEMRKGEENQLPFNDFKKIFIDHPYNRELFGPFGTARSIGDSTTNKGQENAPQRITNNSSMLSRENVFGSDAGNFNVALQGGLPTSEGSDDQRVTARSAVYNYSSWGQNSLANFNEEPIPVIHTVYNPNVEEAFITLDISSLSDTLTKEVNDVKNGQGEEKNLDIGSNFPAVLNIRVETGSIGKKEDSSEGLIPHKTYHYRIVALVEGSTLIDIGNPDYKSSSSRELVIELGNPNLNKNYLSRPFELPKTKSQENTILTADGERGIEAGVIDEMRTQNRYIKVTKLSYETNSALLSKVVAVSKVTEIIDANLPYPFSAIVGTKLDSRSFGSIPKRSFDCKLKKVKVPSNYFPTDRGIDKRYYETEEEFDNVSKENKLIYKGDWNGSFHDTLQWTDNPAWILYDLLTNVRYGMGSHININQINKWQLYKIGRFCDNVDNEGYFLGVTDGKGGKEPRFSCNIVFDKGQKIFDAINTIASLFRGRTFFSNSEINFVDDRPRSAINQFTNESVKDGLFYYSNNRRDEQFNTIEIGYRDRFNNYEPKIEVVEDEEDIKERGIFKKRIEGIGITSKAMARRAAQHQIFSKIKENQQVVFTAGLETLLCKPGDLVIIEDELKTNITNFGKILNVNLQDETIRLSNKFNSLETTGILTIANPTGVDGGDQLNTIANKNRQRYDGFTITGLQTDSWSSFTGDYSFSAYTEGYDQSTGFSEGDTRYANYASYTGVSEKIVYFETGVTGWVLGSGDAMSLDSGDFIAKQTGAQSLPEFNTGEIAVLNMNAADKRGSSVTFSGFDLSSFQNYTRGITNNELSGVNPEQVTTISVTGTITNLDYGCLVSGFDKPEILPLVKLGSAARFQIHNASPFFYKVISMKEENPNEYLVTATKYDTGKFNLIDKNISIENQSNTYSYQTAQTINGTIYETLDTPAFAGAVTTGTPNAANNTFSITGDWTTVTNSTGYGVRLTMPNGQIFDTKTTDTNINLSGLNQVGVFNVGVNALGNMGRSCGGNAYYNSPYINTGIFIVYDELLVYSKSFLNNIIIL